MHKRVYGEFERICASLEIAGSVLEVGAVPSGNSLLFMRALDRATQRIGINLDGPYEYRGAEIVQGNANDMSRFEDKSFDAVLCNATLEHDPKFWLSVAEIHRVTKPGGHVVLGVPGYMNGAPDRWQSALARLPGIRALAGTLAFDLLLRSTLTLHVHHAPGDFYRFSPQAMRDVLLAGMEAVQVRAIMAPPRLIGYGRMPLTRKIPGGCAALTADCALRGLVGTFLQHAPFVQCRKQ